MIRNSYRPLSSGRAASETSFGINLVVLVLSLLAAMFAHSYGNASPGAMFVVMLASLLVFSVLLETLLHPKTCGLLRFKVERSLSWRRVAFREIALVVTFLSIGFVYWLLPLFGDMHMVSRYRPFLMVLVAALLLLSVPYFCIMDRIDPEEEDVLCRIGRAIVTRRKTVTRFELANHARAWAVKAFWLSLMQPAMVDKFELLVYYPVSRLEGNPMEWYLVATTICFGLDLCYASAGYVLNFKLFNTHTRTAELTLSGWLAAISCYWPFWGILLSPYFFKYARAVEWESLFDNGSVMWWIWAGAIILLELIYALATIAAGIRFSNLTYRGLWNTGPYRWTKHPAYVFKGLSWWLISVPFIVNDGADAIRCTLLLLGVNLIYFARAKTEERHLSNYPEYVEYALEMNERSIFRWCAKLIPALKYVPPKECERMFEVSQ